MSQRAEANASQNFASNRSRPHLVAIQGGGRYLSRVSDHIIEAVEQYPFVPKSLTPIRTLPARTLAAARRRVRVTFLVEEEGLDRGARARIAGWLDVSSTTICRDIKALLAAGDPIVTAAFDRASRRASFI